MNWIKEIKYEIKSIKADKKELRKFGLVVGGVFIALGFWLTNYIQYLFFVGVMLIVGGILYPLGLRYLYKIWMSMGTILGFIILRIILVLLYAVAIIPISFLSKIFGKKEKSQKPTYWIKYSKPSNPEEPY